MTYHLSATHWLDGRGNALPQSFFDSEDATSDYAFAYSTPAVMMNGVLVALPVESPASLAQSRYEGNYRSPVVRFDAVEILPGGWHGDNNEINDTLPCGTRLYTEEQVVKMGGVLPTQ